MNKNSEIVKKIEKQVLMTKLMLYVMLTILTITIVLAIWTKGL